MLKQKDCVTHFALEALCLIKVCGNSLIIWGEIGLTKERSYYEASDFPV